MSRTQKDNRVSLTTSGTHFVMLKNSVTDAKEIFEIVGEEGRGGSCIVYRAFVCIEDDIKRPILLKEFYPFKFQEKLFREPDTFTLKLQSLSYLEDFQKAKENFLEICRKQAKFYLSHPTEADELVELQGKYLAGDTVFVTMRAGGGCSWDKINEESIFQICETTLSVLREIKLYHNENLLHCDLKPENVYVFRKTRQHVAILDFGSVVQLNDGTLTGEETLSYSKDYAAPELIRAYGKEGSDRADYFKAITIKADLFSIGALMYMRLTGKKIPREGTSDLLKQKRAKVLETFWQREKNYHVKDIKPTVKEELKKFFDGVLERNPDLRFDAEEMKARLIRLVNETAPPMSRLSSKCKAPPPNDIFFGRERELAQLNTLLNRNNQFIVLYGEGGQGKSSLALKLAWERRNDFEFFWTNFTDDVKQTIMNLSTEPPYPFDDDSPLNSENIFISNLKCLRGYGDTAVLIIDNFDLPPEKINTVLHSADFANLTNLRMKIILTCRHCPPTFASCVEVAALSGEELLKLMNHYYPVEDSLLPQIIKAAKYNTLLIEQAAKMLQQSWGELSPEKLLAQLKNPNVGEKIFDKLRALYDLSALNTTAKKILAQAVLLPARGINAALFLRTHDEIQQDKIRILELSGWLKKSVDNFISLHPLVREVCKPEITKSTTECRDFLENYQREFSKLPLSKQIYQRRERMELVSNAADLLPDHDGQLSKMAGDLNYLEGRARHAWYYFQEFWKVFLKLNPKPDTLEAMSIMEKIAWSACSSGEFSKAIYFVESALSVAEREIGSEHIKLLPQYISFAGIYRRAGDLDKADKLYANAIKLTEENNTDDFTLVKLFINYGKFNLIRGEDDTALTYGNRAMEILNRRRDFPLTMTAEVLEIFAEWSLRKEFLPAAVNYSCEATKIYELYYGKKHQMTAENYVNIARALSVEKKFDETLKYLECTRKILEDTVGEMHPATGRAYLYTARILRQKGDSSSAYEWINKALRIYSKTYGQTHPYTTEIFAEIYSWQGRLFEL